MRVDKEGEMASASVEDIAQRILYFRKQLRLLGQYLRRRVPARKLCTRGAGVYGTCPADRVRGKWSFEKMPAGSQHYEAIPFPNRRSLDQED